ncbi:hypothetical protein Tco_1381412, partial [Tanacetum coccineum]
GSNRCDDTSPTQGGNTGHTGAFARGAIQEELTALRLRVDVAEAENALLHAMIRTMEAIETVTRNHEIHTHIEIERQLASVQESHRQDREDFEKLKELVTNESLVIPMKELRLDDKLNFVEQLIEIMDREVNQLRQSRIPIVKVRWNSKRGPEFTWEREDQIRAKYPHLFPNITPTSN